MGVLLFSVYGMCIYVYVYVYNYVHIACSSVRCWLVTITIYTWYKRVMACLIKGDSAQDVPLYYKRL